MLCESLKTTYDLYTYDTAIFASWLVRTAREHGYTTPLHDLAAVAKPKAGRLKGKARKQMKGQTGGSPGSEMKAAKSPYKHTLAIKDVLPLCHFIVAVRDPKPVVIPGKIVTTLSRLVRVRRSFCTTLPIQNDGVDLSATDTTDHVSLFEKIFKAVRSLLDPADQPDENFGMPHPTKTNPFAELEVYDAIAFLSTIDVNEPWPEYVFEAEDSIEDAYLAFSALFKDALALRARIKGLWGGYKGNTIGLAAAGVATNTTVALVREMDEAVAPIVRKNGGYLRFINVYYMAACSGQSKEFNTHERAPGKVSVDTFDVADHCMQPVWQILEIFRRAYHPGQVQSYGGQYGWYNPRLRREGLSARTKFQQDKVALLELLSDMGMMEQMFKSQPFEDEISRGAMLALKNGDLTFWAAFGLQALLDTMRVLHGPVSLRPQREMRAWNKLVGEAMASAMAYNQEKGLRNKDWPPCNDVKLKEVIRLSKFWDNDPIANYNHQSSQQFGHLSSRQLNQPVRPSLYMHMHAVYCGLWVHYMRTSFHELGVELMQAWNTTVLMGDLYYAMRRDLPQETVRWDDMELMLAIQGNKGLFTGEPPVNTICDLQNYCEWMGYPEANELPTRKKRGKRQVAAGFRQPRKLTTQAAMSIRFMKLMRSGHRDGLTKEDFSMIVAASKWEGKDEHDSFTMVHDRSKTDSRTASIKKAMAVDNFIIKIALALQAEISEVSYDYFTMHIGCWEALQMLQKELSDTLQRMFPKQLLQDASELPLLIGYIFTGAMARSLWDGEGEPPVDPRRAAVRPLARLCAHRGHVIRKGLGKVGITHVIEEWEVDEDGEKMEQVEGGVFKEKDNDDYDEEYVEEVYDGETDEEGDDDKTLFEAEIQ